MRLRSFKQLLNVEKWKTLRKNVRYRHPVRRQSTVKSVPDEPEKPMTGILLYSAVRTAAADGCSLIKNQFF